MPGPSDETRIALLEQADKHHTDLIGRLLDTQEKMADSMSKLVLVEERHVETREAMGRAFNEIKLVRADVTEIQKEMPQLKEVRRWVVAAVLGIVALVGLGAYKVIFTDHPTTPAAAVIQSAPATPHG